jgi:hypothetical protein
VPRCSRASRSHRLQFPGHFACSGRTSAAWLMGIAATSGSLSRKNGKSFHCLGREDSFRSWWSRWWWWWWWWWQRGQRRGRRGQRRDGLKSRTSMALDNDSLAFSRSRLTSRPFYLGESRASGNNFGIASAGP